MQGLRLLFVCTANISRSPYAERRTRQVLGEDRLHVESAGVPGFPDREMDPAMAALLVERGGDASGHLSRSVSEEILEGVDLIVPFEFDHHMRLLEDFPAHRHKIVGFGQLATAARAWEAGTRTIESASDLVGAAVATAGINAPLLDVADPYQRGGRVARASADQIDEGLNALLPVLAGGPVTPLEAPRKRLRWPWS
ncbi:MAG: hypothetical protein Q4F65_10605 [Propionibacteriaceae bacterium]|nr:hypothetical protein [Propionibacteriaceae bacterium]